jgi:RNA polymerase sigma-70 factor, ECF subfamily
VNTASEVDLARRLLAGDVSAFDPFVEAIRTKLFQYSYLTCGQREDAEEVAQETLFRAFQQFDQLREPEHVRTWIFRIARNFCLMKRRKSVFAPKEELSLDELRPSFKDGGAGEGRHIDIADWSHLPERELIAGELGATLRQAIRSLPDLYQATLLLRDVEGLSTRETAEVLDISEDLVKQRLHRARLAVRKHVDAYLKGARPKPVEEAVV